MFLIETDKVRSSQRVSFNFSFPAFSFAESSPFQFEREKITFRLRQAPESEEISFYASSHRAIHGISLPRYCLLYLMYRKIIKALAYGSI
jgi:hypothetical protein